MSPTERKAWDGIVMLTGIGQIFFLEDGDEESFWEIRFLRAASSDTGDRLGAFRQRDNADELAGRAAGRVQGPGVRRTQRVLACCNLWHDIVEQPVPPGLGRMLEGWPVLV